ncbi:MAG: methyltransferase domain-containing protein [Moorea sp. SIO4A1]|uniref:class I SAM-dependent methyltransferase n=1 Tax=Moorena sp. SIO4A1 TaxID=2607835 RepID=UPI00144FB692|nr:methyltransferase domain-containing protein [Moorena sp. SIO4A1]NEQ62600.1 methyltransferase domain-containing protein [Moorena sp. SIO4A1]
MNYLNLGCGRRFHLAWTNVNFTSSGEGVIAHNLTTGIPFPDNSFDVVYHSHLLEHFPQNIAELFLKECYRVLRPQGILRVVVPDLEQIALTYLEALKNANDGSQEWAANYEFILLEMYDQTIRNHSGGEMAAYLFQEHIPNQDFIVKRLGIEAKNLIEAGRKRREQHQPNSTPENKPLNLLKQVYRFVRHPNYRRESMLKSLLGEDYSALQVGRFRQSGEVHQWMYDRYSLATLLKKCGLENIIQHSASESYIPQWTSFNLDTEPDGSVYKPDSLFMEGIKPAT